MHVAISFCAAVFSSTAFAKKVEYSFTDSAQQTAHYVIAGETVHPLSLLIVLHGTGGAAGYKSLAEELSLGALQRKQAVVAVQSPSPSGFWPLDANMGSIGTDVFLDELVRKQLLGERFPNVKKTWFVGYSSGSTFLAGDFIPVHGYKYEGGAILLCGGAWPASGTIKSEESLSKQFQIAFHISKNDFLFPQTSAGMKVYRKLGMPYKARFLSTPGHCGLDLETETARAFKSFL